MDINNLSSNWKQLQSKLKASSSKSAGSPTPQSLHPANPAKRKRGDLEQRPVHSLPRKKARWDEDRKIQQKQKKAKQQQRGKMNGQVATKPLPNGDPVANGSTAADPPTAPRSANTLVNAGLSEEYAHPLSSPLVGTTSFTPSFPSHNDINTNTPFPASVEIGKYIALDCEMVGVGPTPTLTSALARVSLVNYHGEQLYDSYVLPLEPVTDWRTHVSGIAPQHMRHARTLKEVQSAVAKLLKGRVLVGHSVRNDLDALLLGHPKRDVRDTARFPPYRKMAGGGSPRLKVLASELLGVEIQEGEHSSVEDARATMMLFKRDRAGFEREHVKRWGVDRREAEIAAAKGTQGNDVQGEEDADGREEPKAKKKKKKKNKKK